MENVDNLNCYERYEYDRETAEPLCLANIRWHHVLNDSSKLTMLLQTPNEVDKKFHTDIIELVDSSAFYHDVKTVKEETRRRLWTIGKKNYTVPTRELEVLSSLKLWQSNLDRFFFDFEEYDDVNPVKTTGRYYKVRFDDIFALASKIDIERLKYIIIPLKYVQDKCVLIYERENSDIDV